MLDIPYMNMTSGAQEISRELRASEPEHWLDCAIGGLASGALLGHFQGSIPILN